MVSLVLDLGLILRCFESFLTVGSMFLDKILPINRHNIEHFKDQRDKESCLKKIVQSVHLVIAMEEVGHLVLPCLTGVKHCNTSSLIFSE